MRRFDFVLYDPKKFIASIVTVVVIIPLFVIGLVDFTAGASRADNAYCEKITCHEKTGLKNEDNQANGNKKSAESNQTAPDKKKNYGNDMNRSSDESNKAGREDKQRSDNNNAKQVANQQTQGHTDKDCECTRQASVSKKSDMDDSKDKKHHAQKTRVVHHHHRTVVHHTTTKEVKPTQTQPAPVPDTTVRQAQPTQVVVHVQQPAPQVAAAATPAQPSSASTKALPNTGSDDALKIAGVTGVVAGLGHWLYNRRRLEY